MRPHLLSLLGLLLVTIGLFHSVLLPLSPVVANDSPYHQIVRKAQIAARPHGVMWSEDGYLGSGHTANVEVYSPLRRLVPLRYYNTVLFPACVLLAAAGLYAFLLSLGLTAFPAFLGALALALGGHFITCVYSGHAGTYMMWAAFMWALLAVNLAVKHRSFLALVWAGALSALVLRYQFDIGFIMLAVLAAWLVFGLVRTRAQKKFAPIVLGALLGAAVFAALGAQNFFYVLGLAQDASGASVSGAAAAESPLEKWDWATQWSLPVNETASLLFPGLYGWGQQDEEGPYCGAIGRSLSWPKGGMESFSLNTQGEGAVIVLLSLLAVCLCLGSRQRGVAIFFAVVALLGLLLSYGRYCDLNPGGASGFGPYRLFYWLPKMSDMRNPIKFLYPVMLSLAVLTALGAAALADKEEGHAE